MEILSCKDLKFRYNGSSKDTLSGVSFAVQPSQVVLLVGRTGSGKSTLLRLLKKEISPVGEVSGEIKICGKAQGELSLLESTQCISYVSQNPDTQTVTHKVSAELAFALESLGTEPSEILGRVGEMATYFGIEGIYDREIDTLSGGQKQLCALCSAVVQAPKILLLDEPAAQLDPIGTSKLYSALRRLNSELGTTIIIAEHDPQEIFSFCDKVVTLDGGRATEFETREDFVKAAAKDPHLKGYIPACARAVLPLGKTAFTVKDAKNILESSFPEQPALPASETKIKEKKPALQARNVYFRYERNGRDVVSCLDLSVSEGEIFAAVGSNGCGKTTMLKVLGGILKPWQGRTELFGRNIKSYKGNSLYRANAAVMPQDPYFLFTAQTVRDELESTCKSMGSKGGYDELCERFGVERLLDSHPYDLSGGEVQKCALIKLLLTEPKILFLDEPSKALDPISKAALGETLRELSAQGKTIIIATHDTEFAAQYADRCGLFFDGKIHSQAPAAEFFARNRFYTTDASRIARNVFPQAVTAQELEKCVVSGGGER